MPQTIITIPLPITILPQHCLWATVKRMIHIPQQNPARKFESGQIGKTLRKPCSNIKIKRGFTAVMLLGTKNILTCQEIPFSKGHFRHPSTIKRFFLSYVVN